MPLSLPLLVASAHPQNDHSSAVVRRPILYTRSCPDVSDTCLFKSLSISNFKCPALPHFFLTPFPLSIPLPFHLPSYASLFTDSGPIIGFYGLHGSWLFIEHHTVSQSAIHRI